MSPNVDSDRIWRCHCGGHHFLTLSAYGFDEPLSVYVSVLLYDHAGNLWDRIKTALEILWRGKSCTGDIVLDEKGAAEFAAELERLIGLAGER